VDSAGFWCVLICSDAFFLVGSGVLWGVLVRSFGFLLALTSSCGGFWCVMEFWCVLVHSG
jgi:hypothetical protein